MSGLNGGETWNVLECPYCLIVHRMTELRNSKLEDYAVAVIVETPRGIPLIMDPSKPLPHFWKLPGGRAEPGEIPAETASRELQEETTIDIPHQSFTLVHEERRDTHSFFLFHAKTAQNFPLPARSNDGELVQYCDNKKIQELPDLFPNHKILLERYFFPH